MQYLLLLLLVPPDLLTVASGTMAIMCAVVKMVLLMVLWCSCGVQHAMFVTGPMMVRPSPLPGVEAHAQQLRQAVGPIRR